MTAVMCEEYELQQISMIAAHDSKSRLWYRVRRRGSNGFYAVCLVLTAEEIAPAIALYEQSGIVTEP